MALTRKHANPEHPEHLEQSDPGTVPPSGAAEPQADGSPDPTIAEVARADAGAAEQPREPDDRFLRLAAEYDNYRRRTTREKTESFDRGASAFAARLLDVLDDFDRLAASETTPAEHGAYRTGVEMILAKLRKELEAGGLERLDPIGDRFDPELEEAVALAATDDAALDDVVKATFQVGYRFRGTVIRHAKVQVWTIDGSI
jgi:molecular chaperone GrpE